MDVLSSMSRLRGHLKGLEIQKKQGEAILGGQPV